MQEKKTFCFEPLQTSLNIGIKRLVDKRPDKVADTALDSKRDADSGAPEKGSCAAITWAREFEVELRCDQPTEAEIKAVEDFFDWLLAEALKLTGEMGKAA